MFCIAQPSRVLIGNKKYRERDSEPSVKIKCPHVQMNPLIIFVDAFACRNRDPPTERKNLNQMWRASTINSFDSTKAFVSFRWYRRQVIYQAYHAISVCDVDLRSLWSMIPLSHYRNGPWPLLGICVLGICGLLFAATIILSLIPIYLSVRSTAPLPGKRIHIVSSNDRNLNYWQIRACPSNSRTTSLLMH